MLFSRLYEEILSREIYRKYRITSLIRTVTADGCVKQVSDFLFQILEDFFFQQQSRGVPREIWSGHFQKIPRKESMTECNFSKLAQDFPENFQTSFFSENT